MLFGLRNLGFPRGGPPDAPAAPTVAAPTTALTLTVSWSAPSFNGGLPVTSYILERRAGSDSWVTISTNATSPFNSTGLVAGTSYTYRVAAVNAAGASPFSAASNAGTAANVPNTPAAPTIAAPTVSEQLSVSWSAPANNGSAITSYTLQRDANNNSWTTVYTGPNTSFTNTELDNFTFYRYRVLATNVIGSSSYSAASAENRPFRPIVATGGSVTNITVSGVPFRVHSFTNVGTTNFSVSSGGVGAPLEYLIIAGGGGASAWVGGGGGAGGYRSGSVSVSPNTYPMVVGQRGSRGVNTTLATNGGNSSGFGITSTGGGRGGGYNGSAYTNGASGGSGGGASTGALGASGIAGQGNSSPNAIVGNRFAGTGGGGAGSAGGVNNGGIGGNGGAGLSSSITGTSIARGGGGGAAGFFGAGGTATAGGAPGGSLNGDNPGVSGNSATPNTGGGGGGGTANNPPYGGFGGTGVVIVRYRNG